MYVLWKPLLQTIWEQSDKMHSKTCLRGVTQKKTPKYVFKTNNHLMQVKSVAECSWSILQYFQPALCYHVFKTFVLSIFEWPLKKDFTVLLLKMFCGSSSLYCGLVCSVWLWYFLIILTNFFIVFASMVKSSLKCLLRLCRYVAYIAKDMDLDQTAVCVCFKGKI